MHWTTAGADPILALRCSLLNGRFDDFWQQRSGRRWTPHLLQPYPALLISQLGRAPRKRRKRPMRRGIEPALVHRFVGTRGTVEVTRRSRCQPTDGAPWQESAATRVATGERGRATGAAVRRPVGAQSRPGLDGRQLDAQFRTTQERTCLAICLVEAHVTPFRKTGPGGGAGGGTVLHNVPTVPRSGCPRRAPQRGADSRAPPSNRPGSQMGPGSAQVPVSGSISQQHCTMTVLLRSSETASPRRRTANSTARCDLSEAYSSVRWDSRNACSLRVSGRSP